MSADVFTQLRRLATVENDVRRLQETALHRRCNQEPTEGAAVLLLRGLQTELHKIKTESRRELVTLSDDKGFMTLVPLCQALLQHQAKSVTDLESHLSQYGYTPLSAPNTIDEPVEVHPDVPSTPGVNGEKSVFDAAPTAGSVIKTKRHEVDLDRTPTLEDFGLSEAGMAAILNRKAGVFKAPTLPPVDTRTYPTIEPPSSLKKWSSSDSIPEMFRNAIAVTPGLFNGRSVPTVTPGKHIGAGCGPAYRGQGFQNSNFETPAAPTPKQSLLYSLNGQDGDGLGMPKPQFSLTGESEEEDSPRPPVLTTPGVKQLYRPAKPRCGTRNTAEELSESSADNSPAFPVFNTPGLNKLYGAARSLKVPGNTIEGSDGMSSDSSPAYPDFNTPGLKKMHGAVIENLPSSENHTPDPPQFFTPHIMDRLQSKLTKPAAVQQLQRYDVTDAGGTPESPQLTCATSFLVSREMQAEMERAAPPAAPRLASQSHDDDGDMEDLPDTPDLTYRFKNTLKHIQTTDVQVTRAATSTDTVVTSSTTFPVSTVSHGPPRDVKPTSHEYHGECREDDDDLPPEPELTYNFTKLATFNPQLQPARVAPSDDLTTCESVSREQEAPSICEIMKPLTSEDYVAQPSWVQRQLSLQMLESAVQRMNILLTQKAKEGKALILQEKEIGSVTLTCVLMNTKRIMMHSSTSVGTTYTVNQSL